MASLAPAASSPKQVDSQPLIPSELKSEAMLIKDFIPNPDILLTKAIETYPWQDDIKSRRTASFGAPYKSSHIEYPERAFPPELNELIDLIERAVGWRPNNCLLNLYNSGENSMGFHSDDKGAMADGTGVVIISLGAERSLTFRKVGDHEETFSVPLPSGSLFSMSREMQDTWQHALKKDKECADPRISMTFRSLPG